MKLARPHLAAVAALPLGAMLWYGVNIPPPATPDLEALAPLLTCLAASVAGAFVTATGARASRRCLGSAAAAGALVGVVQMFASPGGRVIPFSDGIGALFPVVVLLLVVASAIAGACRGAVFAAAALLVTRALDATRARPSVDSADRVVFASSISLGIWGTGAWVLRAEVTSRALASGALVLGLSGLLFVLVRDLRRLRWLGSVTQGAVPGWALVADDGGAPPDPPIPRFADYDDAELDGYLVKGSGRTERVAELPSDAPRARAPLWRRAALGLAAAVAVTISLSLAARGLLGALAAGPAQPSRDVVMGAAHERGSGPLSGHQQSLDVRTRFGLLTPPREELSVSVGTGLPALAQGVAMVIGVAARTASADGNANTPKAPGKLAQTFQMDGPTLKLPGPVVFKNGGAELDPMSEPVLQIVVDYLNAKPEVTLLCISERDLRSRSLI